MAWLIIEPLVVNDNVIDMQINVQIIIEQWERIIDGLTDWAIDGKREGDRL